MTIIHCKLHIGVLITDKRMDYSLFILINSISGIVGQLSKNTVFEEISNYWYLLVVVLIGGQIGNFFNLKIFPTRVLALLTSFLVLLIAIRMGFRLLI